MADNVIGPASGKSFSELLAETANADKSSLVLAMLDAFKKGDTGAIKIVTQALLDSQYNEETKFPITDARFKEIICIAANRING